MKRFSTFVQTLFQQRKQSLPNDVNSHVEQIRNEALTAFLQKGLPGKKTEGWRHSPLTDKIRLPYVLQLHPDPYRPVEEYFKCQVTNLNTMMLPVLNGWYVHQEERLTQLPNGIILGSLQEAIRQYPQLVLPHLFLQDLYAEDGLLALNDALFNDGIFVYVPDNVKVEMPVQIVSLVNTKADLMILNHNVIYVGKNSELSLIQCDDSIRYGTTFIDNATEISLDENARIHYYKTENKEMDSILMHHVYVHQKRNSFFHSNAITFNAGYVCNYFRVNLKEPHATARLYGLYLVDKQQLCDNQILIDHAATDCKSYQLYKGIMDDEARANFHGHVLVRPDSQRTDATQTNRNILLTDKARITTKPFLEIYADDVQCTHGATVGQLDDEALFYLRSRGIDERNARKLLMFAFANEVVDNIGIPALNTRLGNMVQRRLNGELTFCDRCVLYDAGNRDFIIPIDTQKLGEI